MKTSKNWCGIEKVGNFGSVDAKRGSLEKLMDFGMLWFRPRTNTITTPCTRELPTVKLVGVDSLVSSLTHRTVQKQEKMWRRGDGTITCNIVVTFLFAHIFLQVRNAATSSSQPVQD